MKTTSRLLSFVLIITLLSACTPAPSVAPTATATPAPTATITLTPTVTPSPAPTQTPTPVMPEIDSWMEPHLQEIGNYEIEVAEDGVALVVTTLADGTEVAIYEKEVDGEWRPSYRDMDKFVTEDDKFLLDEALDTLVIRKDGEYKLNQEDYARFMDEVNKIWEEWTGDWTPEKLKANQDKVQFQVKPSPYAGSAFDGYRVSLQCQVDVEQVIRVLGAAEVEKGVILVAIGTPYGVMPSIIVEGSGYTYFGEGMLPEEAIEMLAGNGGEVGFVDLYWPLGAEDYAKFKGEIDPEIQAEIQQWIRANPHDGKALRYDYGTLEGIAGDLMDPNGVPLVLGSGYFTVGE